MGVKPLGASFSRCEAERASMACIRYSHCSRGVRTGK